MAVLQMRHTLMRGDKTGLKTVGFSSEHMIINPELVVRASFVLVTPCALHYAGHTIKLKLGRIAKIVP